MINIGGALFNRLSAWGGRYQRAIDIDRCDNGRCFDEYIVLMVIGVRCFNGSPTERWRSIARARPEEILQTNILLRRMQCVVDYVAIWNGGVRGIDRCY